MDEISKIKKTFKPDQLDLTKEPAAELGGVRHMRFECVLQRGDWPCPIEFPSEEDAERFCRGEQVKVPCTITAEGSEEVRTGGLTVQLATAAAATRAGKFVYVTGDITSTWETA